MCPSVIRICSICDERVLSSVTIRIPEAPGDAPGGTRQFTFTFEIPPFWGPMGTSFVNMLEELAPHQWREWLCRAGCED
eukprot:scaffold22423_cov120-Isochrysis_galbana.AAC.2